MAILPPISKSDVEAAQRGLKMVAMSLTELEDLVALYSHREQPTFVDRVIVVGAQQMIKAKRRMGARK